MNLAAQIFTTFLGLILGIVLYGLIVGVDSPLNGFTCAASQRTNDTEPPEFVCVRYEKEKK
jgi:hypothetical protein